MGSAAADPDLCILAAATYFSVIWTMDRRHNARVDDLVTLDAIRAAAERISRVAVRTPVLPLDADGRLSVKAESLQPVGSFKLRGAYATISALDPEALRRGVITYSSGNHGLAVSRSARLVGSRATVIVPVGTPRAKTDRMRAEGATLVELDAGSEERRAHAEAMATDLGMELVPPYDDLRVIAGQGTIGLELIDQVADLSAVLSPVSGGGLASGIAAAIKRLRPEVRVIGVEPELAADATESLAEGRIVTWAAERTTRTMADGARSQALGRLPFRHLQAFLDDIVTVTEDEIAEAVRVLARDARIVAEPTGAVAPAALLFRRERLGLDALPGTAVAIVSGGNVDPDRYRSILNAEMAAGGQ
jgi:threonine dehydratase